MTQETPPTQCPVCQSAIKHIPAGISRKTGKPYNEFWSCINRNCDFTWKPTQKRVAKEPVIDTEGTILEDDQGKEIIT